MEDVVKYMAGDGEEEKSCMKRLAYRLSCGESSILELIESLQKDLTSPEVDRRMKSCELLANVLSELNPSCLKPKELLVLSEFLCCRLQDHFSIHPPTLRSLSVLCTCQNLPSGAAESIVRTIFKEVHVPSCMQSDRNVVYNIFASLLENHKEEIKNMGNDFLYGITTAIDGEQDPRNLLKVFELACDIVESGIDLIKLAEEFFEVVSCYFPIDFEPPPTISQNKTVVTNRELVMGLRKFLSSSSLFAPYCLPLLLGKLESDVQSAKLDAMATLKECLQIYTMQNLKPFLRSLWVKIKTEVMHAQSDEFEELGQSVMKGIVSNLSMSSSAQSGESEFHGFLKDALEECLPYLVEHLHEKMAWASAKLLIAGAEASKEACQTILSAVIPVLLKHLDKNSKVILAEKRLGLEILVSAVQTAANFGFDKDLKSHPFYDHKDEIIEVFCGCISSNEFILLRTVALAGTAALCNLGLLITPQDQMTIISNILYCMENEKDSSILNDLCLTIGYLSSKWPGLTISHIIPLLKKMISNLFEDNRNHVKKSLSFISAVSTHIDVVTVTSELIIQQLDREILNENNADIFELCLNSLSTIIKANSSDPICLHYFLESIVLPLVAICIKVSLISTLPAQCCSCCSGQETFSSQCITLPIIQKVSEILRTVCQKLEPGIKVEVLCKNLTDVFVKCDYSCLKLEMRKGTFNPFQFHNLPLQTRLVSLLTATLCALHKDIKIEGITTLMEKLITLCQATLDQPSYVSAAKCLAGLLNKQKDPSKAVLEKILLISNGVFDKSSSSEKRISILSLMIWSTKALVLCSHSRAFEFANVLIQLFSDEDLGRISAESFDIILRDTEEVLNASSHACIRLMYKQRFFQSILPKLINGFQALEEDQNSAMEVDDPVKETASRLSSTKANYLTALSHILKFLPKQVLYQHLVNLLPLLVKSLNTDEGPLLVSILATLYCLMQEAQSEIEQHVNIMLDHFLRLSSFSCDMNVRIEALKCIGVMTSLPVHLLLPHKKQMVRTLISALDDKKRLVRREAVKARTEWILLGNT